MSKKTLVVAMTLAMCLFTYVKTSANIFGSDDSAALKSTPASTAELKTLKALAKPSSFSVSGCQEMELSQEQIEYLITVLEAKMAEKKAVTVKSPLET